MSREFFAVFLFFCVYKIMKASYQMSLLDYPAFHKYMRSSPQSMDTNPFKKAFKSFNEQRINDDLELQKVIKKASENNRQVTGYAPAILKIEEAGNLKHKAAPSRIQKNKPLIGLINNNTELTRKHVYRTQPEEAHHFAKDPKNEILTDTKRSDGEIKDTIKPDDELKDIKRPSDEMEYTKRPGTKINDTKRTGNVLKGKKRSGDPIKDKKRPGDPKKYTKRPDNEVEDAKRHGDELKNPKWPGDKKKDRKRLGEVLKDKKRLDDEIKDSKRTSDEIKNMKRPGYELKDTKRPNSYMKDTKRHGVEIKDAKRLGHETIKNFPRPTCINITHPFIRDLKSGKIRPSSKPRTIYFRSTGRLGNALFQVAGLYGLYNATGSKIVVRAGAGMYNYPFKKFPFFEINQNPPDPSVPMHRLTHQTTEYVHIIKSALEGDVHFTHSFQNLRFFEGCIEAVRNLFVFKEDILKRVRPVIESLKTSHALNIVDNHAMDKRRDGEYEDDVVVVGVHIRRGDFSNQRHYDDGYRLPNISYFSKAMDYFRNKYKRVKFVIATNDKPWAQEHIVGEDIAYSNFTKAEDDLALLSECDHVIQSMGTFSWWAGFLCKGTSIYHKNWIAKNSHLYKALKYNERERFLPDWIPM